MEENDGGGNGDPGLTEVSDICDDVDDNDVIENPG